jgi:hypothetical protein
MLRATVGYITTAPIVTFICWYVGSIIMPPSNPLPFISAILSAVYFSSLILITSLPGLLVLVVWAALFTHRLWAFASVVASSAVLLVFAYGSNIMCKIDFMGSDCWGNISFQMTERSPFTGEYPMVFWSAMVCALVFWATYLNVYRQAATLAKRG